LHSLKLRFVRLPANRPGIVRVIRRRLLIVRKIGVSAGRRSRHRDSLVIFDDPEVLSLGIHKDLQIIQPLVLLSHQVQLLSQPPGFSDVVAELVSHCLSDNHSFRVHKVKHPVRLDGVVRNLLCFQNEDHAARLPLTIETVTLLEFAAGHTSGHRIEHKSTQVLVGYGVACLAMRQKEKPQTLKGLRLTK